MILEQIKKIPPTQCFKRVNNVLMCHLQRKLGKHELCKGVLVVGRHKFKANVLCSPCTVEFPANLQIVSAITGSRVPVCGKTI